MCASRRPWQRESIRAVRPEPVTGQLPLGGCGSTGSPRTVSAVFLGWSSSRGPQLQAGVSLVEIIIFIVIVSVSIAGLLTVMDNVVKSSSDPVVRKQSVAMADAILEEVLSRAFTDPDGTTGETTRAAMDDVSDYSYFDGSTSTKRILGSQLMGGTTSPLPDTFWASVSVVPATVSSQSLLRVTVTVTNPQGETFALSGYRGNY